MNFDYFSDIPSLDITIEALDGVVTNFSDIGIKTLDLRIPSPEMNVYYENIPGAAGLYELESHLENRIITGSFILDAEYTDQYVVRRDALYALLARNRRFYLIDSRAPMKRWLVRLQSPIDPQQIRHYGIFEIEFISASPYSESTYVASNAYEFVDMFTFVNEGTAPIDPRVNVETTIRFKGTSTNLRIFNDVTGDIWQYNGSTTFEDIIELKGVTAKKNGISIFPQTNKQILTFEPGANQLWLTGMTEDDYHVRITTRFYYI